MRAAGAQRRARAVLSAAVPAAGRRAALSAPADEPLRRRPRGRHRRVPLQDRRRRHPRPGDAGTRRPARHHGAARRRLFARSGVEAHRRGRPRRRPRDARAARQGRARRRHPRHRHLQRAAARSRALGRAVHPPGRARDPGHRQRALQRPGACRAAVARPHRRGALRRLLHLRVEPADAGAAAPRDRVRPARAGRDGTADGLRGSGFATAAVRDFNVGGEIVHRRVCWDGPVFDIQEAIP